MTHICVGKLTIIGSDNGLSPGRLQAIIWTNAGILLIEPLGTKFNEILIGIQIFSFTKMLLKMSSAKWRPFCLGLNVLTTWCSPGGAAAALGLSAVCTSSTWYTASPYLGILQAMIMVKFYCFTNLLYLTLRPNRWSQSWSPELMNVYLFHPGAHPP